MLTHNKLILLFLLIILAIVLILQNQKNNSIKTENFANPKFIESIYGVNINKNETCQSGTIAGIVENTLDLNKKKDNLVNARLCYSKKEYNPKQVGGKKFINRIFLERPRYNNINYQGDTSGSKGYITSKSDYLGCYQWKGKTDIKTTDNRYFHPLPNNKNVNNINYLTLNQTKSKNRNKKIFMSGEIRDEMAGLSHQVGNDKKSIGGSLTDEQFQELKKHRVPDKYCLGRRDLNPDNRVKNYLGGVGTVAVYKNGSSIDEADELKLFMRDAKISQTEGCEESVSLECALEFKKHVLAEFNFAGLFVTDDAREFDRETLPINKIQPISYGDIFNLYKNDDNTNKFKRLVFLDRSGNQNHMILDYNYLNFLGAFDLRNNFKNIKDYNEWLIDPDKFKSIDTESLFTDSTYKLDENNRLILSRYKDINRTSRAKYYVTSVSDINPIENGKVRYIFCENWYANILKFDSMVMRGTHNIWPYLGMIGWWQDKTRYQPWRYLEDNEENDAKQYLPIVIKGDLTKTGCLKRIKFSNINDTFGTIQSDKGYKWHLRDKGFSLRDHRGKILDSSYDKNTEYGNKDRVYWLENSNFEYGYAHDCNCYGSPHIGYNCNHLDCLNFSYMHDIHHYENPNPLYVSISQTLTRKCFRHFNYLERNILNLDTQPRQEINDDEEMICTTPDKTEEGINKKIKNNNKFFMRGSNKLMSHLQDEYAFILHLDRNKSEPETNSLYSIDKLEHKYSSSKNYCKNLCGNPIISISSNFKNKYDKNEVKFYPEAETNEENKTSNQAFLWCYMHNYNNKHKIGNRQDGLVYTIPKKVKSIGFAPNGGRLCISKITVYNKEGKIINTYLKKIVKEKVDTTQTRDYGGESSETKTATETSSPSATKSKEEDDPDIFIIGGEKYRKTTNFKIFRKDEYFAYDNEKYIIDKDEFEHPNNEEKSFCFTSNPIEFTKKCILGGKTDPYEYHEDIPRNRADLGYLDGRAKNNININTTAVQYEPLGCYNNINSYQLYENNDYKYLFYGRIGAGSNNNIATETITDSVLGSSEQHFYTRDQGIPTSHTFNKTLEECKEIAKRNYKNNHRQNKEIYFGMEAPGDQKNRAECLPLPGIPKLFTKHPCQPGYKLLPDGTCQDNKYLFKRPDSECQVEGRMSGKYGLGAGYRLQMYKIKDKEAPPIPISKSPQGNGGLKQKSFSMRQYTRTYELDENGNRMYEDDGKLKFRYFEDNEVRAYGKNNIFVTPLNERLKKDDVGENHSEIMGIQRGEDGKDKTGWYHTNDGSIADWVNLKATITENSKKGVLTLHQDSKTHPGKYGLMIFPRFELPATSKDFYLIQLEEEDYVSRIVVECSLKDAVTHMNDMPKKTEYFFESTINSVIKNQFEKTEMFLYDQSNTNNILEDITVSEDNTVKRIRRDFDPYSNTAKSINSIKFETIYKDKDKVGFDDKNATIDFYNVGFIQDKFGKAGQKSVAIICEKNKLYLKSCRNNNVRKSKEVNFPKDFLITKNKNFNYKIGNLFHNFSDVKLRNLKILGKSFFEDNRKKSKPAGYSNTNEYQPGPMIDKILINYINTSSKKNQYSTVSKLLKNSISRDNRNKEMNIIKFLDTTGKGARTYNKVPGKFIKYQKDKSKGFSDLHHNNNSSRDTIVNNILYAPKLPINP